MLPATSPKGQSKPTPPGKILWASPKNRRQLHNRFTLSNKIRVISHQWRDRHNRSRVRARSG